jgi:hypothetical protein
VLLPSAYFALAASDAISALFSASAALALVISSLSATVVAFVAIASLIAV